MFCSVRVSVPIKAEFACLRVVLEPSSGATYLTDHFGSIGKTCLTRKTDLTGHFGFISDTGLPEGIGDFGLTR